MDVADVDALCQGIRGGDQRFDLNGDQSVDPADLQSLVEDLLRTSPGDANLDGIFDSSDLVRVSEAGEYEDGVAGNSTWAEGDWNCDGEFTSEDLVMALASGAFRDAAGPGARNG